MQWLAAVLFVLSAGTLPASLLSSPAMAYLDLANNALSGGIAQLPPNLVIFNISNNLMDDSIQSEQAASCTASVQERCCLSEMLRLSTRCKQKTRSVCMCACTFACACPCVYVCCLCTCVALDVCVREKPKTTCGRNSNGRGTHFTRRFCCAWPEAAYSSGALNVLGLLG